MIYFSLLTWFFIFEYIGYEFTLNLSVPPSVYIAQQPLGYSVEMGQPSKEINHRGSSQPGPLRRTGWAKFITNISSVDAGGAVTAWGRNGVVCLQFTPTFKKVLASFSELPFFAVYL